MKFRMIILFVLLINGIYATCSEGQIDINSASLEELDKLKWVGPTTAQNIIDARPFKSVDDLINISRITIDRVNEIKDQGLACVEKSKGEKDKKENDKENEESTSKKSEEDRSENKKDDETEDEEHEDKKEENSNYEDLIEEEKEFVEEKPIETIKLNSKNIKTEDSLLDKEPEENFAICGLASFCILLGFLFSIKKLKFKNYKNEFD
ncbi:MAG: helix-hairpin-helix domain-containing protein [Candidatus Pacearchaeota archaeon]|jgi:hypothetical protein